MILYPEIMEIQIIWMNEVILSVYHLQDSNKYSLYSQVKIWIFIDANQIKYKIQMEWRS